MSEASRGRKQFQPYFAMNGKQQGVHGVSTMTQRSRRRSFSYNQAQNGLNQSPKERKRGRFSLEIKPSRKVY